MKANGLSISQKLNFNASNPPFALRFPTMGADVDYFGSNSAFALEGGVVEVDPFASAPYLIVYYDPDSGSGFLGTHYREISFKVALTSFSGEATFRLSFSWAYLAPIDEIYIKSVTETFVAGEYKTITFRMNRDDFDSLKYVESGINVIRLKLDRTSDNGFSVSEMYIKRYIPNIVTWAETIDLRSPLNPALSINKLGGIDELSFSADKADALLLYKDSLLSVDYDGVRLGYAYVTELTDAQTTEGAISIRASGFARRLSEVNVTVDYSANTLAEMIAALPWDTADVFYDASFIELPTGALPNGWNVEGETLYDIAKKIVDILNINYATEEYIFQVNADRYIEFRALDSDLTDRLIEGVDFHAPAVTQDSSLIVNTIRAYRTKAADTTDLEFVDTYVDAASVVENGEKVKDLVVSSYMETATIARMAAFILSKYATPVKKIAIGTFPGIVPFARYGVQYKSRGTELVLIEGVSVDEIDDTYSPLTFATIQTDEGVSGRTMLFVGTSSLHPELGYGDTAELAHPVFGATAIRIRGRMEGISSDGQYVRLMVYDSLGNVFATDLLVSDYGAGFVTIDIPLSNLLLAATAIYEHCEVAADMTAIDMSAGSWGGDNLELSDIGQATATVGFFAGGAETYVETFDLSPASDGIDVSFELVSGASVELRFRVAIECEAASLYLEEITLAIGATTSYQLHIANASVGIMAFRLEVINYEDVIGGEYFYLNDIAFGSLAFDGDAVIEESDEGILGDNFALADYSLPENFVTNVSKIRFTSPLGGGITIDRLSLLKKTTRTDYVSLEKVSYDFAKGTPVAALELGGRSDSLVDEFIELSKDADTLKRVFAK